MKVKVALFIPNLEGGGAERVIVTLANQFYKKGYSVDLVLVRAVGPYLMDVDNGVNIISLDASKNSYSLFPFIKYLRRERPEAVLSTLLIVNIVAVLAKIISGVNTKIVLREAINASADQQFKKGKAERYLGLLRKWALKKADVIISPSFGVKSDLILNLGIQESSIEVIYNPIDIERVVSESFKPDSLIELFDLGKPVILGMGRLNGQKNFDLLIRSFHLISNKCDAILLILGEGNERKPLEELIEKLDLNTRVFLPGFVSNPFVYLRLSSVFVLSSRYEGMPNALIQAAIFQKPIVSTDCPSGPSEILNNGEFGCLVDINDENAIGEGILKGIAGNLTIHSKEYLKARYEASVIAEKYLEILLR